MRGMLLVNPKATTTNYRTRDVLIRALGAAVDLVVEETAYRGHAAALAATAHAKGFDLVAVLGGDGTINETVNGLLAPLDVAESGAAGRPGLIVIPGGSANVFARALGLPNEPVEATGAALEALREGRRRVVGLGQALWEGESRYFTFCSGMGYDAEVIRAVEGLRGAGLRATPGRYVATAVRHFFMTDRRQAAMTIEGPGIPKAPHVYMAIVSNTTPWSYIGNRPVHPTPWAGFETGLDLLGLQRMGLPAMLHVIPQILGDRETLPSGRDLVQLHDEAEFTLTATRPAAFQLDGDYLGERERVTFRSIPNALQVLV
ncbi:diacylglycerol kinase family protein [Streptosporangium soli]|nr:diacylglycerol kinase family lipid kinase [Streptosporangium sp. KLBMP 9127]